MKNLLMNEFSSLIIIFLIIIYKGCSCNGEGKEDGDGETDTMDIPSEKEITADEIPSEKEETIEAIDEKQDEDMQIEQIEDIIAENTDALPPPPCEEPPPPALGSECTSSADCGGTHPRCLAEEIEEFNGEQYISWPGGYCMEAGTGTTICDIENPVDSCPEGMRCMYLYNWGNSEVYGCMDACYPEKPGTNPPQLYDFNCGCREGYYCHIANATCLPGCSHDRECCEVWRDENKNYLRDLGEVEVLSGCTNWCDNDPGVDGGALYNCVNEGTPGAEFSGPCIHDSLCPADGRCLDPINYTDDSGNPLFKGGYCLKDRCDAAGRGCTEGGGHCANLNTEEKPYWACVKACHVGDDPDGESFPCRKEPPEEKMTCMPFFIENPYLDTTEYDGYCWYGNFNSVSSPDYGNNCQNPQDCWSPLGLGNCYTISGKNVNFCSVICNQTLAEVNGVCGSNGEGVCWASQTAMCWASCDTPGGTPGSNGCPDNGNPVWACYPTSDYAGDIFVATGAVMPSGFCFPACDSDSWCAETFGTAMVCDVNSGICH